MNHRENKVSRRDLLKGVAASSAIALSIPREAAGSPADYVPAPPASGASVAGMRFDPKPTVRMAIIGVGSRGSGMLPNFLAVDHVQVTALCDVVPEKAQLAAETVMKSGQKTPALYTHGDHDFENLCKRDDIDFVYIATPWEWHLPMALAVLNNGKHAGVEVPGVTTIEDCWAVVTASEHNRRHCMIMENCCYGFNEMMVNRMVHEGAFGDVVHAECAYLHDLRGELFAKESEGLWRRAWHEKENGNLYPTHGLGPVAWYFDINRGDRFDYLVSMSSPERGLSAYRATHLSPDDPRNKEKYISGDVNTSLIKTSKGRTIMLQHDVSNPRPYDRINLVAGTKGIFRDYPPRIYMDGDSPEQWSDIEQYKTKFQPSLWRETGKLARQLGGHGGMDFVMVYRLMKCMQQGLAPDFDVYDLAAWSSPAPLSIRSVRDGSSPKKFPDFTRGGWEKAGQQQPS